jgi:hypothetical protein
MQQISYTNAGKKFYSNSETQKQRINPSTKQQDASILGGLKRTSNRTDSIACGYFVSQAVDRADACA